MSEATFRAQMQGNFMASGLSATEADRIIDLAIRAMTAAKQAVFDALDAENDMPVFIAATGLALQMATREFQHQFEQFKETTLRHGVRPVRVHTGGVQ